VYRSIVELGVKCQFETKNGNNNDGISIINDNLGVNEIFSTAQTETEYKGKLQWIQKKMDILSKLITPPITESDVP